jgi:hypothetical protein
MSARKISLAIRIVILGGLVSPVYLSSQMPSFAKLIVRSTPTGAEIVINGNDTRQKTDAEFVVSPGDYTVSVSGSANCGNKRVTLATGETRTLTCSGGTWSQ